MRCELENEEKQKVSRRTFDRTWWKTVQATLRALGCNGVDFRTKTHMEHTDDPGRKDHQELDLGR